jgi:hypothetical protein
MGQQGRHDQRAEHTRAGMEQAQPARHGNAAPRPCRPGYRAWNIPGHRPNTCEGPATARRLRRSAVPHCRSARAEDPRSAAGVWHEPDRRPPHCTASPTHGADDGRRYCRAAAATGSVAPW